MRGCAPRPTSALQSSSLKVIPKVGWQRDGGRMADPKKVHCCVHNVFAPSNSLAGTWGVLLFRCIFFKIMGRCGFSSSLTLWPAPRSWWRCTICEISSLS